jgi:hypothetical protein
VAQEFFVRDSAVERGVHKSPPRVDFEDHRHEWRWLSQVLCICCHRSFAIERIRDSGDRVIENL